VDVFKYLKRVDTLLKEGAADEAREMGLEYAGYAQWRDPKSGLVTHISKKLGGGQTKLVKLDKPKKVGGEDQPQKEDPKTLPDFRKDAPRPKQQATTSVADQMGRFIPGGPTPAAVESGDVEEVEKGMKRGRGDVMSANRKDQVKQQSKDLVAQREAEKEAEAAAEAEQQAADQAALEKEMGTPEGRVKDPSEFRTIDQVVDEVQGTEFRRNVGFTDELPSSNEEYLKKIKDNEYYNGVEFIDLKEVVDTDNIGVPPKYFDTLSRALITKNVKGETDNWSHYGEGLAGGAGQINSQMGELMTLVFASSSLEDRKKLSDVIRSQVKSAKQKGSVKKNLTGNRGLD
jgi:hypothetical protein